MLTLKLLRSVCAGALMLAISGAGQARADDDWTGFYVGGNIGGADADIEISPSGNNAGQFGFFPQILADGAGDASDGGLAAGAQMGFNQQVGQFVFGIEGDFNSFKTDAVRNVAVPVVGIANTIFQADRVETDWLVTLRPRVGLTNHGLLIYATGGLAVAEVKHSHVTRFDTPGIVASYSRSKTKTGWVAGGGIEFALSDHWSVKAEYLYIDLGSISGGANFAGLANATYATKVDLEYQTIRGGVNFRF